MAVVIAVPGSEDHASQLGQRLGVPVVIPEVRTFPDGEIYVRIDADLVGQDAILCGSLHRPAAGLGDKFLQVAFLAGTARDLGARRVGLVAPYLAFMRQDARFKAGEGITAKYFADLVSRTVDWLVTVDPHLHRLDALAKIYSIPTTIARAAPAIAAWVTSSVKEPVLVGPDAESEQWVAAVAARCGAPFIILEKTRRGDRDVSVTAPGRTLTGYTPVLIDDIVSTGRTMLEATRMLCAAGSAPPMCVAIHAVFADAVQGDLVGAGARGIVTCNTIPHASNQISVCDSIADATRNYL
ncbi:MAG: ribose-phosphate diphosphokinase [Deltaproteobacteria bacterium]|nr:ribose-phosphate diphosphokinase [Deltaproteobacteria bacterium]